ncbi:TetR/AcrR family transcriptional regulator [Aestuariicella sp. G3-2]|uniref:TetR/AcrR family transcriptional regulator n=1 Tax=Pseudomaricurvus albidus TaxID=2842452 RepID=UPI001C0CC164|nr:TetR/AcrR family transcriptional regulator [Aestuariicella albida]MBU3071298.1 TetR/AcrR family transcriptional regulator [Aestuariicella albida]
MAKNASKDMGNRPGTAVQRKGRERVEQILDIATQLLIEEGHGQFTMNQLAKRLGIRISNLQYYFPSREQLIQQLLQRFLDKARDGIDAIVKQDTTPRKRLLSTVDYVLKDQENESSCKIIWEIWALSARDDKISEAMDNFYESYCKQVYDMLIALNPEVPARKVGRISALIVSMIEGLSLMRGFGKRRHTYLHGIEKELRETILQLIHA